MARIGQVSLLAVALVLAGCAAGERQEATIQRSWPAAGIKSVRVDGLHGSVNVRAGKSDQVQLVAKVKSRGFQSAKDKPNQGYFVDTLENGTLRIGEKRQGRVKVAFPFFHHTKLEIDYDLVLPPTVDLDLNTINSRIATKGVVGGAEMTTENGEHDAVIGGEREVHAKAVNGRIRAKFMTAFAGARLKTVNGTVEATLPQTASFTCNLSQVNGDFEASFPLNIHSHPGSRRVSGEVNGGKYELQITT